MDIENKHSWENRWTGISQDGHRGYVNSLEEAQEIQKDFEAETCRSFVSGKKKANFGLHQDIPEENFRLRFHDIGENETINSTDTPFVILSTEERHCEFGKDKNKKKKGKYSNSKRKTLDDDASIPLKKGRFSKKIDCQAKIIMKEVFRFTEYKARKNTAKGRRTVSENLRRDLKVGGSNIKKEHLIYIRLPKDEDHKDAKKNRAVIEHHQQMAFSNGNASTSTNTNGMACTNANLTSGTIRARQPLTDDLESDQQNLLLLLNAVQCKWRQQTNEGRCSLPDCKTMKNALHHMKTCNAGRSCQVKHCFFARRMIKHIENCTNAQCHLRVKLKQFQTGQNPANLTDMDRTPGAHADIPLRSQQIMKLIQNQLTLLLHAHKCIRRHQTNRGICYRRHCKTLTNVLHHRKTCNAGKSCQVAHCSSSAVILKHWENCTRNNCIVCLELKFDKHPANQNVSHSIHFLNDWENSNSENCFVCLALKFDIEKDRTQINHTYQKVNVETTIQQKIQVKQTPKVDVVGNRRNLKIKKEQSDILFAPAKSTSPANKSAQADQQQQIQIIAPKYLKEAFLPIIEKIECKYLELNPSRKAFHSVDLNKLDVSTIKEKLKTSQYTDPWQFCDDVRQMFDIVCSHNRKISPVYQETSKMSKEFEKEIDGVMQSLGYCCGQKYVFSPNVLYCCREQHCVISRDAIYYSHKNGQKYCEKCFKNIQGSEVELSVYPGQPATKISKTEFSEMINDQLFHEPFVECVECGRKLHQICVLHVCAIWPNGFKCDNCHALKGTKRMDHRFTAKSIPNTRLSTYLENKVSSFLKNKDVAAVDVTIKVLSSGDKVVKVKPGMNARFCRNCKLPENFQYTAKAIFAFQKIGGHDVCFFGMYVQEYGSDCPQPNNRRIYISYLDSVQLFQPCNLRTNVYHEILIGYLDYVKRQGYLWAHIWACPPGPGDDYIFHCHPPEQKIPTQKRLQDWYRKLLDKAKLERCVLDYKDIKKDVEERNVTSAAQIPHFEGDFWNNKLENLIVDQKKDKTICEVEATAVHQKSMRVKNGNAGNQGVGIKKENITHKTDMAHCDNEFTKKLFATVEKHRKEFIVITLNTPSDDAIQPPIIDPDPQITCDLMGEREFFLDACKEKHYEFSSLRRAQYSTLVMLTDILSQTGDNLVHICKHCKARVGTWWH